MKNPLIFVFSFLILFSSCKEEIEEKPIVKINNSKIWKNCSPAIDSTEVSVFAKVLLRSTSKLNVPITTAEKGKITGKYMVKVDELKVFSPSGELKGNCIISGDSALFSPDGSLPYNTKITVKAKAHYEIQNEGDKDFKIYTNSEGQQVNEEIEYSFTTVNFDPIDIIKSIGPNPSISALNYQESIVITFKYPIEKPLILPWNKDSAFVPYIDYCKAYCNNSIIETQTELSADGTSLTIKPLKTWIPRSDLILKIKNQWTMFYNNKMISVFDDSENINTIHLKVSTSNNTQQLDQNSIDYTYPVSGQYFLLKNEYSKGYMKLRFEMPSIIDLDNYNYFAKISSADNTFTKILQLNYNPEKLLLTYDFPSDELENETIYKIEYLKISKNSITSNTIYKSYFRTSMYNTFKEKLNAQTYTYGEDFTLINAKETYDIADFNNTGYKYKLYTNYFKTYVYQYLSLNLNGLVRLEIIPNKSALEYIEKTYKNKSAIALTRDTSIVGMVPFKSASILNILYYSIDDRNFNSNKIEDLSLYKPLIDCQSDFEFITRNDFEAMGYYSNSNLKYYVFYPECYATVKYVLPGEIVTHQSTLLIFKGNW